ncbi:MAG: DUF424 family protein [Candidatus Micrarchaeota archaeon]|nr:DUF424 family protein [Candidatus Micrarchaeota archaeon]
MGKILFNTMEKNGKVVIAICDADLIGKKFSDGKIVLDLDRYRKFYLGEDVKKVENVKEKLKKAIAINVVGKSSIKFISDMGYDVKNCIYIGKEKIPHIQIYKI